MKFGKFDLVYFTGVLYHNPEQLRFIQKLYDKLNYGGVLVFESATTRKRKFINENVVEIPLSTNISRYYNCKPFTIKKSNY